MIFEEVKFKWRDKEYVVPPGQVLRCIAAVEATGITLGQLVVDAGGSRLPLARLSQALGAALRFAGASVSDDEVYDALFADPKTLTVQAVAVAISLQSLMIPPARMRETEEKLRAEEERKADAGKAPAGAGVSLSSATASSSVPAS